MSEEKQRQIKIQQDNKVEENIMQREQWVRLIAGFFVLVSLGLGWFVSPYWFLFTAFVGVNLFQSSLTRWCLMDDILRKLGVQG